MPKPHIFLAAISIVVILAIMVMGWVVVRSTTALQNQARLNRIEAIYASLNLSEDSYQVAYSNVFGDKRPYSYDSSRSFSSEIQYVHGDTVKTTLAELDTKIKAAGFTYFEEPYPGGAFTEYHYKSAKGEYVRLNVSSKPYDDAWRNSAIMKQAGPNLPQDYDTNQGPTNVIIKVNLDDNNE